MLIQISEVSAKLKVGVAQCYLAVFYMKPGLAVCQADFRDDDFFAHVGHREDGVAKVQTD